MSSPDWIRRIREQANQYKGASALQSLERAVTTCCEVVMNSINDRLHDAGKPPIPTADALNEFDRQGYYSQVGIYSYVQMVVSVMLLRHGRINNQPIDMATAQRIQQTLDQHTDQHHVAMLRDFIDTHPQLQSLPETASVEKLSTLISKTTGEAVRDWVLGKPSNPIPKPPSGRAA